jgi:hypothetical protein
MAIKDPNDKQLRDPVALTMANPLRGTPDARPRASAARLACDKIKGQ